MLRSVILDNSEYFYLYSLPTHDDFNLSDYLDSILEHVLGRYYCDEFMLFT